MPFNHLYDGWDVIEPIKLFKDSIHDDDIKWKHCPRGHRWNHRANASDTELWCFLWSLILFSLTRINGWVNNREAGDLRRHRTHCDVTVMWSVNSKVCWWTKKLVKHLHMGNINSLWPNDAIWRHRSARRCQARTWTNVDLPSKAFTWKKFHKNFSYNSLVTCVWRWYF